MKDNEYQCCVCDGVFEKGWTDDEAMEESEEVWGAMPPDELEVVCDDCYNKMMGGETVTDLTGAEPTIQVVDGCEKEMEFTDLETGETMTGMMRTVKVRKL